MTGKLKLYHIPGKSGTFKAKSKANALKQARKNRPATKLSDLRIFNWVN